MQQESQHTIGQYVQFFKLLRVELVMFVMSALIIKVTATTQLIQDKICLNDLGFAADVCRDVATSTDPKVTHVRDAILQGANDYRLYTEAIATLPSLVVVSFLGPWTDRFSGGRKLVMVLVTSGWCLDLVATVVNIVWFDLPTPFMLTGVMFSSLVGGPYAVMAAVFSQVTRETPVEWRATRFAVVQLLFFLGAPTAGIVGGHVLTKQSWFVDRLHNYMGVMVIALATVVFCLLWVIFLVNDKNVIDKEDRADQVKTVRLADICDLENVKTVGRVLSTKRPNGAHWGLWILLYTIFTSYLAVMGELSISFTFAERVYGWDATIYSYYSSCVDLVSNLISVVVIHIMLHVLGLSDTSIAIAGLTSLSVSFLGQGLWLTPVGYVVSHVAGLLNSAGLVGAKSSATKLVASSETGSLFTLISLGQLVASLSATYMFTALYNATMSSWPGLIFVVGAHVCAVPIVLLSVTAYRARSGEKIVSQ
ncbi:Proton-coupled folate transporter [Halotydeus destructor]|nr:Proton-coupled folate transporter [Halotydeus destructor]